MSISFLSQEQVRLFRSDFRYVADYFVQMRTAKDYKPGLDTITHVDAVLKLMYALTRNKKFEQAIPAVKDVQGGMSMVDVFKNTRTKELTESPKG